MFRLPGPHRFPDRLRALASPDDAARVELVLARSRAFLAVAALLAIYLDPTEPSRYAGLAYTLLLVYVAFSLVVMRLVRGRPSISPAFRFIVHAVDVLLPALITLFTQGSNSPFFVMFLFVLLAAAYRWGFRATLATASTAVLLMFIEAALLTSVPGMTGEFAIELNRLMLRSTYLLIMGVLLGYLAEKEKQLGAEGALAARIVDKARVEKGLRGSLQGVFEELLVIFGAKCSVIVIQEAPVGRVFLWEARPGKAGQEPIVRLAELEPSQHQTYLFGLEGHSWHAVLRSARRGHPKRNAPGGAQPSTASERSGRFDVLALDADGKRLASASLPAGILSDDRRETQAFFAVSLLLGDWTGRTFLFDPEPNPQSGAAREAELRFLQTLIRQAGPALYNIYLLRRLRSRAGAIERSRVARELHDGAIQSLTAAEMEVDVLRREAGDPAGMERLARVQQLLRQEILNLRELMQQMKPIELGPTELLDFLADSVEKFRRETGICASFSSELEEVALPPRVGREVARIVQEALVNVRKHAGARNVLVRFAAQDGGWKLVVDDDGRGFSFAGRLSQHELDASRKGPLVIKERVRAIGGTIEVESNPGRGARLEITLPRKLLSP